MLDDDTPVGDQESDKEIGKKLEEERITLRGMTHVFLFLLDVDPADTPAPVGDQAISSRGDPEGRRIDGHRRTAAQHLDIQVTEQLDQSDRPTDRPISPSDIFTSYQSCLELEDGRFEAER